MEIRHKKNTVYYLAIPMVDSTTPESLKSGETVADIAYYKDGAGSWTSLAITDTFSEIASTGMYEIDLTAAELNHDQVIIKLTSTNTADSAVIFHMFTNNLDEDLTVTAGYVESDVVAFNSAVLGIGAIPELGIIESGTAGTITSTTLDVRSASPDNTTWDGTTLMAYGSTQGYWQTRVVISNTVDTLTVDTWDVTPSGTVTYILYATPLSSTSLPVDANVVELGSSAQSLTDLKDFADAGYDPGTNKVTGVVLVDTVSTLTNHTAQTGDTYALANGSAGFVAIDTVVDLILVDTGTTIPGTITTLQSDTDDIQTRLPAALVSGLMSSDVTAISTDTTAADNLELMYDGTGYTDETAPSSRSQVGALATGAGGISKIVSSFTLTTGTVTSGSITSTEELDGTSHEVEDTAGNTEFYYEFDIGGDAVATTVTWDGYTQSNGDSYAVFGYDWVLASFQQVGTITASNGTTINEEIFVFTVGMTGTGVNSGLVRCQFTSVDGTKLATDRILVEYTVVSRSTGYANGSVWVDGTASNVNTEDYVDGVADNPVSTLAAAKTIALSLNLGTFTFIGDTNYTLDDDYNQFTFTGAGQLMTIASTHNLPRRSEFVVVLGGTNTVSTTNAIFFQAAITGSLTTSNRITLLNSFMLGTGNYTAPDLSLVWTKNDFGLGCYIDVTAMTGQQIRLVDSSGDLEIRGLGAGDSLTYSGTGSLTLHSTCTGGTVEVCGPITLINNGSGMTIDENTLLNMTNINSECDTAISDASLATAASIAALNDISAADILTSQLTEAYAANGVAPTVTEAIMAIHQMLMQHGAAGTAITVKKLDNSTTAFTVTLDDADDPTSAERQ